jgi:hypothetical protein
MRDRAAEQVSWGLSLLLCAIVALASPVLLWVHRAAPADIAGLSWVVLGGLVVIAAANLIRHYIAFDLRGESAQW